VRSEATSGEHAGEHEQHHHLVLTLCVRARRIGARGGPRGADRKRERLGRRRSVACYAKRESRSLLFAIAKASRGNRPPASLDEAPVRRSAPSGVHVPRRLGGSVVLRRPPQPDGRAADASSFPALRKRGHRSRFSRKACRHARFAFRNRQPGRRVQPSLDDPSRAMMKARGSGRVSLTPPSSTCTHTRRLAPGRRGSSLTLRPLIGSADHCPPSRTPTLAGGAEPRQVAGSHRLGDPQVAPRPPRSPTGQRPRRGPRNPPPCSGVTCATYRSSILRIWIVIDMAGPLE
jgi:hypothetical protein